MAARTPGVGNLEHEKGTIHDRNCRHGDSTMVLPSEYLEVIVTKR